MGRVGNSKCSHCGETAIELLQSVVAAGAWRRATTVRPVRFVSNISISFGPWFRTIVEVS